VIVQRQFIGKIKWSNRTSSSNEGQDQPNHKILSTRKQWDK